VAHAVAREDVLAHGLIVVPSQPAPEAAVAEIAAAPAVAVVAAAAPAAAEKEG
jgi:hypothetical protein